MKPLMEMKKYLPYWWEGTNEEAFELDGEYSDEEVGSLIINLGFTIEFLLDNVGTSKIDYAKVMARMYFFANHPEGGNQLFGKCMNLVDLVGGEILENNKLPDGFELSVEMLDDVGTILSNRM